MSCCQGTSASADHGTDPCTQAAPSNPLLAPASLGTAPKPRVAANWQETRASRPSRAATAAARAPSLLAEEDLQHVAVLDLVGLALRPETTGLLRLGHRAEVEQVFVGHRFGADEAPGEVGVDGTS